ncbi:hypothetical protein FVA74_08865 [Salinibacterium sp. dk2585]|nr:hypothetical protein FVA74_08865 [Salinibacterium sp. dk2585]TXK54772.1 hypothetical protein FVP63_07095 [Salinibacterium sp. dk5596]
MEQWSVRETRGRTPARRRRRRPGRDGSRSRPPPRRRGCGARRHGHPCPRRRPQVAARPRGPSSCSRAATVRPPRRQETSASRS